MARPSVTHDGFLIPNASDVSDPRMAEPDRIDFNTLAHNRWGVIDGCLVTVSGSTATTLGGTAVVDGVLVTMAGGSAPVGIGGAQDRFDILACDLNGTLRVIVGTASTDPVFPDPGDDMTALAVVMARAGASSFTDDVVDKRKFLSKSLLTSLPAGDPLVQNDVLFKLSGNGLMQWATDTWLSRTAAATLRVQDNLIVNGDLTVGDDITADALTLTGKVQSLNLISGTSLPGSAGVGTIYQHETSGRVYVWRVGGWQELATLSSATPLGTVLTSLQPPSVMFGDGWIPIDGRTVTEAAFPSLFTIVALQPYISGINPNRVMTMPNATRKTLLTDWAGAGVQGGPANNQISLNLAQMPAHKHDSHTGGGGGQGMTGQARTGRGGAHAHTVTGGAHGHPVSDPGHAHYGMDLMGSASAVICTIWGGINSVDAYFNDRNHTYAVDALMWTMPAVTGITIGSAGSEHGHLISQEGDHDHGFEVSSVQPHDHPITETEKGANAAIDITPSYLTVYTYVRS